MVLSNIEYLTTCILEHSLVFHLMICTGNTPLIWSDNLLFRFHIR
jgi:hypothetical protein